MCSRPHRLAESTLRCVAMLCISPGGSRIEITTHLPATVGCARPDEDPVVDGRPAAPTDPFHLIAPTNSPVHRNPMTRAQRWPLAGNGPPVSEIVGFPGFFRHFSAHSGQSPPRHHCIGSSTHPAHPSSSDGQSPARHASSTLCAHSRPTRTGHLPPFRPGRA